MAMSYEGIVSRKDTDRGVTLRAKVVTPNKLKADVKTYDVTVEGLPLSAYDKAMFDAEYVKNQVYNELGQEEGIKNVAQSIGELVAPVGPNGSTISCDLVNTPSFSPITGNGGCFNSSLIFTGKPGIGKKDAVGEIKITATNEGKSVTLSLPIRVKAQDVDTFLNQSMTFDNVWDYIIRGNNAENGATKGYATITSDLSIGTGGVKIVKGSDIPENIRKDAFPGFEADSYIKVVTTVTDSASASLKTALYDNAVRIDADGVLKAKPAYDDVLAYVRSGSSAGVTITAKSNTLQSSDSRWFTIDGIGISCTVQFCDSEGVADTDVQAEPKPVVPLSTIKISTLSEYFTNDDAIKEAFNTLAGSTFVSSVCGTSTSPNGDTCDFRAVEGDVTMATVMTNGSLVDFEDSTKYPVSTAPVIKFRKESTRDSAVATVGAPALIPVQLSTTVYKVTVWDDLEDIDYVNGVDNGTVFSGDTTVAGTVFESIFGVQRFTDAFAPGTATNANNWIANLNKEAVQGKAILIQIKVAASAYSITGEDDPAVAQGTLPTSKQGYAFFKFAAATPEEEPGE